MENENFDEVCGLCGTDHSDPDDELQCLKSQVEITKYQTDSDPDDEPTDIDDDYGRNPYDGTYDDCYYDLWQDESDL